MASQIEKFARELARIDRRLRHVETQPQLAYSSIEDGAVQAYTGDTLALVVGRLPDGTTGSLPVNGPPPPQPAMPTWESTPRGFAVTWHGDNADGSDVQPLDWARVTIHAAPGEVEPTLGRGVGTIETPQGGTYQFTAGLDYAGTEAVWTTWLVAYNTSGRPSAPSDPVVIKLGRVESLDIADLSLTVQKFNTVQHLIY